MNNRKIPCCKRDRNFHMLFFINYFLVFLFGFSYWIFLLILMRKTRFELAQALSYTALNRARLTTPALPQIYSAGLLSLFK